MPKIVRVFTELLYCYIKPETFEFMEADRARFGVSRSHYIDEALNYVRKKRINLDIEKPLTVVEKLAIEKQKKVERARKRAAAQKASA